MGQDKVYTKQTGIKTIQKDQGFTLIEVLIALTIFAVGLLAVAAMQTSAITVNSTADQITTRITWAQDKMEELMALQYNDQFTDPLLEDLGDPPSGTDSAGNLHQETISEGPVNYTITWTVTDNTPVSGTKLITVTVSGKGKTTQVSYVKPGL